MRDPVSTYPVRSMSVRPVARPCASPHAPAARLECVVCVNHTGARMPSLAAARVTASLRARGHAVRYLETDGADLLRLPALRQTVDVLVAVDADDSIRVAARASGVADGWRHDALVPDFTDLPLERTRLLPISAASASGAARPLASVLHEIREYARRHAMPDLVFVDPALNGPAGILGGLVDSIQRHAHGVQWMAAVRVGHHDESDGLSRRLLRAAALAGLRGLALRASADAPPARIAELVAHAGGAGITTRVVAPEPLVGTLVETPVGPLVERRAPSARLVAPTTSQTRPGARQPASIALIP